MASPKEVPKYFPIQRKGLAQADMLKILKPEEILNMTEEEFEKKKMLFSSEFLLGLEHGATTPTTCIASKFSEGDASFRPPPVKRRINPVTQELMEKKKTFCLPPKRVLFVRKPLPVSDTQVSATAPAAKSIDTVDAATAAEVKPAVSEKSIAEITNLAKPPPRKYTDFLRRAGLEPKESVESNNQYQSGNSLIRVKVPWSSLSYYRSFGLRGIYFYADVEPKLEPWDIDPAWYLKSSEFTVIKQVELGNECVQAEHVSNSLLMYSSRRGISSKDRTYYKRHGPAGPVKFRPFQDAGRERIRTNKYPPSSYRGYLANYLGTGTY